METGYDQLELFSDADDKSENWTRVSFSPSFELNRDDPEAMTFTCMIEKYSVKIQNHIYEPHLHLPNHLPKSAPKGTVASSTEQVRHLNLN